MLARPDVDTLRERLGCPDLVGRSEAFRELLLELDRVARFDLPVLLGGETGTGKTVAASVLHRASARARGAFVSLSCPALPDALFERELFGSERGAYTGSDRTFSGLVSVADGGTLMLEEVGDLSPVNQAKLLQFLDDGRYRRLGGHAQLSVDVRIVAASSRDLQAPGFRSDLLHRLAGYPIRVPGLAERLDDVPLLASAFLELLATRSRKRPLALAASAVAVLVGRAWPGNLRELRAVVQGGLVRAWADGAARLEAHHLSVLPGPVLPSVWRQGTDAFQRYLIEQALAAACGNKAAAARRLGLARSALYSHIDRLGVNGR